MSDNDYGRFVLGFWVGALAGAAAALLLAPFPGEEARKQIRVKTADLGEQVKEQAGHVAEQARTRSQQLRTDAVGQGETVQERGRVIISEGARRAQQALETAQTGVNRAVETATEKVSQIVDTVKEKTSQVVADTSGNSFD